MRERGTIIEYDGLSLSSIHWSAVFSGMFFALAIEVILGLLAFVFGAGPHPNRSMGFTGISAAAGIWFLVVSFVGFYAGGWLAARLCGSPVPGDGRAHGIVTWAFATIVLIGFVAVDAHNIARMLAPMFNQAYLTPATVSDLLAKGAIWGFFSAVCGLIGAALGGHVGAPRIATIDEDKSDIQRAA